MNEEAEEKSLKILISLLTQLWIYCSHYGFLVWNLIHLKYCPTNTLTFWNLFSSQSMIRPSNWASSSWEYFKHKYHNKYILWTVYKSLSMSTGSRLIPLTNIYSVCFFIERATTFLNRARDYSRRGIVAHLRIAHIMCVASISFGWIESLTPQMSCTNWYELFKDSPRLESVNKVVYNSRKSSRVQLSLAAQV